MRKTTLTCVAAVAVVVVAGPVGSASAATHTVSMKVTTDPTPKAVNKASFTGKPFGKGKAVQSETKSGERFLLLKPKGGTIRLSIAGGPDSTGTKILGNWKVLKGTGKYKGIKGKGSLAGDFQGHLTYTGTMKY